MISKDSFFWILLNSFVNGDPSDDFDSCNEPEDLFLSYDSVS